MKGLPGVETRSLFAVRVLIASFALLIACTESTVEPPVLVSIQGTVQDSLAAKPAAGVTVQLGSSSATTDFLGEYQFANVAAGNYTITVSSPGFEAYTKPLTIQSTTTHNIPLRRTRPFMTTYATTNNSTVLIATVVDLQGEGTISAGQSSVFYSYSGGSNLAGLAPATRTTVDALTARFQVNAGQVVTSQTRWVFNDTGGNRSEFLCSSGSGCVEQ